MTSPRLSIRTRLALLVGALFLGLNLVLLSLAFLLVRHAWLQAGPISGGELLDRLQGVPTKDELQRMLLEMQREDRRTILRDALRQSWIVLLALTLLSMAIAWVMSGVLLQPVRTLLTHIRSTSEVTLGTPLNLAGPADEFRDLGDAYDAMQERISTSFESQRRFSANAAHELRTPLAIMRVEAELLTSNEDATDRERASGSAIVAVADRTTRVIDGLLALSRAEGDFLTQSDFDFADLVGDVAGDLAPEADRNELDLRLNLTVALIRGDEFLLRHLVTNLLQNAILYNRLGGWVEVTVSTRSRYVRLEVSNSGTPVTVDPMTLFAPFQRGDQRDQGGVGLGLAVVSAVAIAHEGTIIATAPIEGGLLIVVSLPGPPID